MSRNRDRWFPFLGLCLWLAAAAPAYADPPAASDAGEVRANLSVGDSSFSNVRVKLDPDDPDNIAVEGDTLLYALDYWLKIDRIQWLQSQEQDGLIRLGLLRTVGISGRYDEGHGEIVITIPDYLRRNLPVNRWFRQDELPAPYPPLVGPTLPFVATASPSPGPSPGASPSPVPLSSPSPSPNPAVVLNPFFVGPLLPMATAAAGAGAGPSAPPSPQNSTDALFESVFKKKRPAVQSVQVALVVGGDASGEVIVHPDPDPAKVLVQADPVLHALDGWLDSARLGALGQKASGGMLPLTALRDAGLKADFDDRMLRIVIDVPLDLQKMRVKSFLGRDEDLSGAIMPPPISGYVNVNASEEVDRGTVAGSAYSENQVNTILDGVVNVDSLVFEGQATYSGLSNYPWQRGDVNVTKDFPSEMLRTTVGDLTLPSWGYERPVPMGGVGASTEFSTRPNVNVTALSHHEIELKFPSTVYIYRNGMLVQTLQLREGRYDLRDIPAASGSNDITIEVVDPTGRKETINLSQYFFSGLLAPGLQQFSYDAGYPWLQDGPHRDYDTTRPTLFLSHKVGFSTALTAGAFLERDPDQAVAGAEAIFPALWGVFQVDGAASRSVTAPGDRMGSAVRAFFSYTGPSHTASFGTRSYGLGLEYHSPSFYYFGVDEEIQPFTWDAFGTYTEPISPKVSMTLGASYSLDNQAAQGESATYRVSAGLNRNFDRGTSGTVTLAYNNAPGAVEGEIAFYLNWSFPEKQQLVRASYDSLPDRTTLSWDQNSNSTVGTSTEHLEFDRDDTGRTFTGEVDYLGNRGELALREDVLDQPNVGASDTVTSRSRVTAAGALVFAGANFALSRQVQDSFVLIKPGPAQRGQVIEVNPLGNGDYFAQTDWMGNASLTPVSSYQKYRVHLGDAELSGDATLPAPYYSVVPTYKSGVLISLATGRDVVLRGRLRDAAGKPVPRISGELVELSPPSDEKAVSEAFFSNRVGLFQIENLRPGKYEFRFFDETWKNVGVEIPSKAEGLTDIGDVMIPLAQPASAPIAAPTPTEGGKR